MAHDREGYELLKRLGLCTRCKATLPSGANGSKCAGCYSRYNPRIGRAASGRYAERRILDGNCPDCANGKLDLRNDGSLYRLCVACRAKKRQKYIQTRGRVIRAYKCSVCGGNEHNRRSCNKAKPTKEQIVEHFAGSRKAWE